MSLLSLGAVAAMTLAAPIPAHAQHEGHGQHDPAQPTQPLPPPPAPDPAPADHSQHQAPVDHSQHQMPVDHSQHQAPVDHSQHQMPVDNSAHPAPEGGEPRPMAMTGAFGPYASTREASGTAWQPDASIHGGLHAVSGDWMLMGHLTLNAVYDWQQGPRGDEMAFVSGMAMGAARRDFANGDVLQFRAMLSPDPLMGRSGYPLLLAAGETADGVTTLVDRQHPHDLFMELSASYSHRIGDRASLFLYAGLPGEPAFGPPAFMHRMSIMDSPEAPITHHWLDSTHISFGVVTTGLVVDHLKVEASRFNAREPDQDRYDIETGPLDSTSLRLSWNPSRYLSLQGSWGRFISPEQLEPDENQTRWSASLLYADDIAPGWKLAGTLAWGRKSAEGHDDDAFAAEASLKHGGWTVFGRGEIIQNRELTEVPDGPAYRVGKISLGAVRDLRLAEHLTLGAGGLFAVNFVPGGLAPLYGGGNPTGAMGFVRLKLD